MRKHRTRWVAILGVSALSVAGPAGLAGSALADEEDARELSWPVVRQSESSYSLDGYEIGYLPPGLERYGINATSTSDRQGGRQSQLSWVQGPDQLYGRVSVIRSQNLRELDDLRESRYSHIPDRELELVEGDAAFENGAYLSEETGDLFWLDRPGVAVAAHLQPDRWEAKELRRMAEEVTGEGGAAVQEPAQEPVEEPAQEPAEEPAEEPVQEPAEEPAQEPAQEPAGEAPVDTAPDAAEEAPAAEDLVDEVVDEAPQVPAEEAPETPGTPVGKPETPVDPAPEASEAPALPEAPEAPVDAAPEAPAGELPETPADDVAGQAPEAQAPEVPETPAEVPGATDGELPPTPVDDAVTLPGVDSRAVKGCLLDNFVDFETGDSGLDESQLTKDSGEFVERALSQEDLDDAERDRLLATVWYYGDEGDKNAALDTCAQENDIERAQVEEVLDEVADLIAELVAEADAAASGTEEAGADVDAAAAGLDTVDDAEWRQLWDSLPWSVPTRP
ncbi:hypothetical protein ACFVWN_21590 [Nocardiopsis flavescens]|uniref:Uncharacterized protein n=1 Tax=Nocardiopsis flavescens TaxID=758803 RepID=A0A1M6E3C0_9ACTN|nr:hypothetical protein [Nocardiopsis flavescens]SHI79883.1 hypothetical protein SAMN05421803_102130 [Nocardiopsis flavescens]